MITARRIVLLIDRLYELAAAPSVHHEQIPQIAVRVRSAVIVVPSAAGNVPETFDAPFRSDETDPVAVMVMRQRRQRQQQRSREQYEYGGYAFFHFWSVIPSIRLKRLRTKIQFFFDNFITAGNFATFGASIIEANELWLYLILGGLFEMGWAVGLKLSQSMPVKIWGILIAIFSMALSMFLLYVAQRTIAIGTAYVVWTGIGAVGTLLMGIFFFGDSAGFWRLFSAALIVLGGIGMKLSS